MNARQAMQENESLTIGLLTASKEMAERLKISVSDAIDKKVAVYVKWAKSNNEAVAWGFRGDDAKKMIDEKI